MRHLLSRRTFLIAGAAALVTASSLVPLGAATRSEAVIAGFLRRNFPGLAIPDEELHAFARNYLSRTARRDAWVVSALDLLKNSSLLQFLPAKFQSKHEWLSRHLITTFLFSTDFFTSGGQDPRRTSYVAYADPYEVGCRNPLAAIA